MISATIKGIRLELQTDPDLFSPDAIDKGTLAMLSAVEFRTDDKLLDLGCGYGAVGITAAKLIGGKNVIMCDVSKTAVECAKINACRNGIYNILIKESDGYENIEENDFTMILSNPPYHTDFSVAKRFIEGGYERLISGGRMLMVTKRLDWYKNKLISVFGGVKVREIDGYYVFEAERREKRPRKSAPKRLSKKLSRKYGK